MEEMSYLRAMIGFDSLFYDIGYAVSIAIRVEVTLGSFVHEYDECRVDVK